MSLTNCKECGRLFMMNRTVYCTECQAANDSYYFIVRNYLKKHPKSTMLEIHKETGVPIPKLLEINKADYIPFG